MKALGLTFGVAVVLLAPAAIFLYLRSSDDGPGLREETPAATSAAPSTDTKAGKAKRAYPEFDTDDNESAKPVKSIPAKPPTVVQAAQRPPERRFPTPADLPPGMEKSKLIANFGRPVMSTVEVNQGRTLETFHYLRQETGTETVVLLTGGRVLTSATISY